MAPCPVPCCGEMSTQQPHAAPHSKPRVPFITLKLLVIERQHTCPPCSTLRSISLLSRSSLVTCSRSLLRSRSTVARSSAPVCMHLSFRMQPVEAGVSDAYVCAPHAEENCCLCLSTCTVPCYPVRALPEDHTGCGSACCWPWLRLCVPTGHLVDGRGRSSPRDRASLTSHASLTTPAGAWLTSRCVVSRQDLGLAAPSVPVGRGLLLIPLWYRAGRLGGAHLQQHRAQCSSHRTRTANAAQAARPVSSGVLQASSPCACPGLGNLRTPPAAAYKQQAGPDHAARPGACSRCVSL